MANDECRKMVLRLTAGHGMDSNDFVLVPSEMAEEDMSTYAWEAAVDFATGYGLEPECNREEYPEDAEIDEDRFTDDIDGRFEDYIPEKHDGLVMGYSSVPSFRPL